MLVSAALSGQIPTTDRGGTAMPLSDLVIKKAKFLGKPFKLTDEKGLYLLVTQAGKLWRLAYRFGGKQKTLAIGVYPTVTLKHAREKRDEAKRLLADNIDPSTQRRLEKRLTASGQYLSGCCRRRVGEARAGGTR